MRIAYFHTNTIRSSWVIWSGARALRRLGHEVVDCPVPTDVNGRVVWPPDPRDVPLFPTVQTCDLVIVAGIEYLDVWLAHIFGTSWHNLPKLGFSLESSKRSDYAYRFPADSYRRVLWADPHDGPAFPPMVDTKMFCPDPCTPKTIDAGSMCTMYPRRVEFMRDVKTPLTIGQVSAWGIDGNEAQEAWTRLYVDTIRSMKVHVDLPSNNPQPCSRPYETMAAGTCLLTWAKLPEPFVEGRHYVRYRDAQELDAFLADLLSNSHERNEIATAGWQAVQEFDVLRGWQKVLEHAT